MNDLISRQAAITAICEDGTWLESQGCTEITMCERKQRDADILSELPTINAVEVVRCKDCIYRFTSCPMIHWRQNGYIHFFTEDTDYCSKGRKYEN